MGKGEGGTGGRKSNYSASNSREKKKLDPVEAVQNRTLSYRGE